MPSLFGVIVLFLIFVLPKKIMEQNSLDKKYKKEQEFYEEQRKIREQISNGTYKNNGINVK
jgi:hypothetical protein